MWPPLNEIFTPKSTGGSSNSLTWSLSYQFSNCLALPRFLPCLHQWIPYRGNGYLWRCATKTISCFVDSLKKLVTLRRWPSHCQCPAEHTENSRNVQLPPFTQDSSYSLAAEELNHSSEKSEIWGRTYLMGSQSPPFVSQGCPPLLRDHCLPPQSWAAARISFPGGMSEKPILSDSVLLLEKIAGLLIPSLLPLLPCSHSLSMNRALSHLMEAEGISRAGLTQVLWKQALDYIF